VSIGQKHFAEECIEAGAVIAWHRHSAPYAAVILSGTLDETSESGRRKLRPGDVAIHAAYEAHADRINGEDVTIVNIPLGGGFTVDARSGRLDDMGVFLKLQSAGDMSKTAEWLFRNIQITDDGPADLPDVLACDLAEGNTHSIGAWARERGVRAETVSRQFRKAYGLSPKQFRAAVRARSVLKKIASATAPLSEIALQAGYADQAHMIRAIVAMTGRTPGAWRRSTGFNPAA